MVCPVNTDGYCKRHKRRHFGHGLQIALDPSESAEKFRIAWDGGSTTYQQPPTKPLLRSLPLAKQCKCFGAQLTLAEVNEKKLAGCRQCNGEIAAYHCTFPGQKKFNDGPYTRGAECMSCEDWVHGQQEQQGQNPTSHENRAGGAGISWPANTTIRHLLYHIYPVSNGHWRWNVEQLCGRLKAFNGHRIVAIAVDPPTGRLPDPTGPNSPDRGRHIPGCDSVEEVKAEFAKRWSGEPITFMEFENDPSLREVKSFIPMLEHVLTDDPNHITLYAQAKGTTRHNGHIARRWTETLYEIMFDHFPLAEEMLKDFPVVGCFKKLGPGWTPEQSHSDWHYSGSWFWFRNAELAKREWWKQDMFWSGIEPYPSQQFKQYESGCIFHEAAVPTMNLYNQRYWRSVVTPAFNRWREEMAKWRTEMWPK